MCVCAWACLCIFGRTWMKFPRKQIIDFELIYFSTLVLILKTFIAFQSFFLHKQISSNSSALKKRCFYMLWGLFIPYWRFLWFLLLLRILKGKNTRVKNWLFWFSHRSLCLEAARAMFVMKEKRKHLVYCPWKFPLTHMQLFLIAHAAAVQWKRESSPFLLHQNNSKWMTWLKYISESRAITVIVQGYG